MNWKSIDEQPPNELVEVMDDHGCIGKAYPIIHPFRAVLVKGEVTKCEPYWDGEWQIDCSDPDRYIHPRIIKWREIK